MVRLNVLLCAACILVAACDSTETSSGVPSIGAAQDDGENTRLVTVYLQSEPNNGFTPVYIDRVVVAEPVIVVPKNRAEGRALVQNTNTVILGDNCTDLLMSYPELLGCDEVESVEFEYGEVESTATTDSEGFSALLLGQHDKYRISVKSWVTGEDDKCHWGGSEILESNITSLGVPVLVFCE